MKPILGLAPDSPSLTELGGTVWPIDTQDVPMAFNPSVCRSADGRLAVVARRTNYQLDTKFGALTIPSGARGVKNATYFSYLEDKLTPIKWEKINFVGEPALYRGAEDARLLRRGNDFYLNVVLLEKSIPRARIAIYKLNDDLTATHVATYPGKSDDKPEKNWMTNLESEKVDFKFVTELSNNVRGGSSLVPWKDGYIALCHKTYLNKKRYYNPFTFGVQEGIERSYTHLFVEFDSNFNPIKKSKEFFLVDRGIEFATSLIVLDNQLLLGFGKDDKQAWFGKISTSKVEKMLSEGA